MTMLVQNLVLFQFWAFSMVQSGYCWASLVFKEPTTYTLAAQWACLSLACAAVGWLERKAAGVGQVFSQAQGDGCRPRSCTGAVSGTWVVGVEAALQVLEQSRSSVTPDLTKKRRWKKLLCFLLGARQKLGRRLSCALSLPCWLLALLPPSPGALE